ncbi:MAG TPA: hypothetical protein VKF82_12350 [Candidatus Eremiobacteraceae bacterium]|nr:hypothetical protein [Candidatus Eremiobacteraceae bacterium]
MALDAPELDPRVRRGEMVEGWAFTFCKAAFLALLFGRYTLLATAGIATILYLYAGASGVREWRCFVKPPWIVIAMAGIAAFQVYWLFFRA